MTRFERKFRRVARSLRRVELMQTSMDEAFSLGADALLDKNAGRRFLDYYGDEGVLIAFERYGLLDALRRRGYDHFVLDAHALDARHTLLLDANDEDGVRGRLLELVVRRDRLVVDEKDAYSVLTVDWLSLRNPAASFSEHRPRLPGQDAPGLGVGERVLELLYRVVERLSLDGLATVPEYFHNAVLYARELPYLDAHAEGHLRALERLLFERENLSLSQASWAMDWGYVVDVDDSVVRWTGEAMVWPHCPPLRKHVRSRKHVQEVHRIADEGAYQLRRRAFDEQWDREREALTRGKGRP